MSSKVAILNQPLSSGKLMDANGPNEPTPITSTMKIRDEVLTCRLCSERFRLSDKRPLALRCMHTFCEECLGARSADNAQKAGKGWPTKKTSSQIVCPVCETKTAIGKETDSYKRLPVNQSFMELLKILEQSPSSMSKNGRQGAAVSSSPLESNSTFLSQQQQQQQRRQQQQQHSASNFIIVDGTVAADHTVCPVSSERPGPEPPAQVKAQGRRSGASITIGSERQTDGTPLNPTNNSDMMSSSISLVSTVSVGSSGVMKPMKGAAASSSDQSMNQRDNQRVSNGAVANHSNQPTSATQTSLSTSVHVGAPSSTSYNHSSTVEGHRNQATDSASAQPIVVHQLCDQCRTNPAGVTVASASKMTALQLCSDCAKPAKKTVVQPPGSRSIAGNEMEQNHGGDETMSGETTGKTESEKPKVKPPTGDVDDRFQQQQQQQPNSSKVFVGANKRVFGGLPASASVYSREKSDAVLNDNNNSAINNSTVTDKSIIQLEEESRRKKTWSTQTSGPSRDVILLNRHPGDLDAVNGRTAVGNVGECNAPTPSSDDRSMLHNTRGTAASDGQVGGVERNDEDLQIPGEAIGASTVNESIQTNFEALSIRPPSPMDSSAPSIDDIYPPPCDNPPFNPDYRTLNAAMATRWQRYADAPTGRDASNGSHAESDVPATPPPAFQEKDPLAPNAPHLNGRRTGVPGRNIELSFAIPSAVPTMPEQPPRYDEVVAQPMTSAELNRRYPGVIGSASTPRPAAVDAVTPMPTYGGVYGGQSLEESSNGIYSRLVRSFGKYSENSTQPAAFRAPTRISSSEPLDSKATTMPGELQLVVTDRANATVQVFTPIGECLSLLHVEGVSGCCLWSMNRRLVAATDDGVQVFDINGTRLDTIPLGPVLAIVRYQSGFIAVQSKVLSIFEGPNATLSRTIVSKATPGQYNRMVPFNDIRDVAVTGQRDLVVLESIAGGASVVNVMTEDGFIKYSISPSQTDPSGPLRSAVSVAVDRNRNIFIALADTDGGITGGRIVMFTASGRFASDFPVSNGSRGSGSGTGLWPAGITFGVDGQLYAVVRGEKFAEIRVYTYV